LRARSCTYREADYLLAIICPQRDQSFYKQAKKTAISDRKVLNQQSTVSPAAKTTEGGGILSKMWKEIGERRAAFDCATPKAIPSPFHTQQMLQDGSITEAQAHALEQSWLKELKSMYKKRLDQELQSWADIRHRYTTRQTKQEGQALELQLKVIRQELWRKRNNL
jgi:hypothetical protein